ncbi:hypothetical protein Gotur_023303 [Gossypium turneri]
MILLQRLSVAFVDLIATAENIPPGSQEPEFPEVDDPNATWNESADFTGPPVSQCWGGLISTASRNHRKSFA